MPWLASLVDGSEESMTMLPVQCLCEFLLMDPPADAAAAAGHDDTAAAADGDKHVVKLVSDACVFSTCSEHFVCRGCCS